jgi:mannosyltransferase OCH1-like enzyme
MKWIILGLILILILVLIFYFFGNKIKPLDDELKLPLVKYYEERIKESKFKNESLINYVSNPGELPKIVHRVYITPNKDTGRFMSNQPSKITLENLDGWEEIVYSREDIDKILYETFGSEHKITRAYNMINEDYIVMKSDLFRYIICYLKGGLYLDNKSFVKTNLIPIPEDKEIILSHWDPKLDKIPHTHVMGEKGEYMNWYIYSKSGSKILEETINTVVDNILRIFETPILIKEYDFLYDCPGKRIVLPITGPIALTLTYNVSQYKDTAYIINMFKYLEYCHPSCKFNKTKNHYSNLSTFPLISNNMTNIYIPKNIYMTYYDIENIPQYVYDNIKKNCKDYKFKIYNDDECIDFIMKYYGQDYVDIFNKLTGAHKADFWRYCILYIHGGVYFDVKTNFQIPINEIFDHTLENTWYTVIDKTCNCIYNGIIATYPCNKIIGKAIKFIIHNHPPRKYNQYIRNLYTLIKKENNDKRPRVGENKLKNGDKVILFKESCTKGNDRYGYHCTIQDKNQKSCFITRYDDFPWK